MRSLWLLLVAGLLIPGGGCCRTMQHTAGICDADPPPVQSLLTPPAYIGHPSLGVYANVPHDPPAGAVVPKVETIPNLPKEEKK